MSLSSRIRERLADVDLSQAELARRVGVRQSTINSLAKGESYGSKYLHRIARELGTTPAYLMGETDDPDADAPAHPELNAQERELVDLMRGIPTEDQAAIMRLARTIASSARSPTVHAGGQEFRGQGRR